MKEVLVMVALTNLLVEALEEKSRVDERAKLIALGILSRWVEEQLELCTADDGSVTRGSMQKSEAMSTELYAALSTALGMENEAIASQATTMLRLRTSRNVLIPDLVRFDTYAMSKPWTIRLQYKH